MKPSIKKYSLILQSLFYLAAGLNHFVNPQFYYDLIPPYLPFPVGINALAGVIEFLFGLGFLFNATRRATSIGVIMMLLAFIPSHWYFIEIGGCVDGGLCVPQWVAWLRLIAIHPLLILWAWFHRQ